MKIIFFKNESGDEPVPLFKTSKNLTDDQILSKVKELNIDGDYDPEEDHLYGHWYLIDTNDIIQM